MNTIVQALNLGDTFTAVILADARNQYIYERCKAHSIRLDAGIHQHDGLHRLKRR